MEESVKERLTPYVVGTNKLDIQSHVRFDKLRAVCYYNNEKISEVLNHLVDGYLATLGESYVESCENNFNNFLFRKSKGGE